MKKKRKIFESLRFNVFSFVYNVFLKFATPLESGEPFYCALIGLSKPLISITLAFKCLNFL